MAIPAMTAAGFICKSGRFRVTNLALQKVLYLAHMLHLGDKGRPLIKGHFEAWDYGPVQPRVYHHVKAFGSKPIPDIFWSHSVEDDNERETLRSACDALLNRSPGELVAITHWDQGAWARNYRPGQKGLVIPDEHIAEEYTARLQRQGTR